MSIAPGIADLSTVPRLPWIRVWILAISGVLLCAGILEGFWRSRGHRPSVADSPGLWAYHRGRLQSCPQNGIVVIGSSRALTDFSPDVVHELLPSHPFVQLAISGTASPIAVLEALAADKGFSGLVVCDVHVRQLQHRDWDGQLTFVRKGASTVFPLTSFLRANVEGTVAFIEPNLSLRKIMSSLRTGRPPWRVRWLMHPDRSVSMHPLDEPPRVSEPPYE